MKKRLANIELLRITAMIFVVILHTLGHGKVLTSFGEGSVQHSFFYLIEAFAIVAVNVYVLISGYFLSTSGFKFGKILYLVLLTFLYSVIIYLVMLLTGQVEFDVLDLVKSIFPIITGKYWFVTCYAVVYLLSPFLNVIINAVSKKKYLLLLCVLLGLFSLIPTLFLFQDGLGSSKGMSILWFVCLYFVGAYIRKYDVKIKYSALLYLAVTVLLFLSTFALRFVENLILGKVISYTVLYNYNSLLAFFSSVFLFLAFKNVEIRGEKISKIIPFISSATLSVYLIHDEPHMRAWLWGLLDLPAYAESGIIFLVIPLVVIGIFTTGIICGLLVEFLLKKIVFPKNAKASKIDAIVNEDQKGSE